MTVMLIIRMVKWDDEPFSYTESRRLTNGDAGLAMEHMIGWSKQQLGRLAKGMVATRVVTATQQTCWILGVDGMLEFVDNHYAEIPPPRQVKVINNPSKPQTTWLSALDPQMGFNDFPEETQ